MEITIEKLLEEINAITEDELVDEFPVEAPVAPEAPAPVNKTAELDSKTKISRALDVLQTQIDDFKNAVMVNVESLDDMNLINAVNGFDVNVATIRDILDGTATQQELPVAVDEPEEETAPEETEETDENEEADFQDAAELDLFGNKE